MLLIKSSSSFFFCLFFLRPKYKQWATVLWSWHWILNPGALLSQPLSGSMFDSAFHPVEVDEVVPRSGFWNSLNST